MISLFAIDQPFLSDRALHLVQFVPEHSQDIREESLCLSSSRDLSKQIPEPVITHGICQIIVDCR